VKRQRRLIVAILAILGLANILLPVRVEHLHIDLRPSTLAHLGPMPVSNTLLASLLASVLLTAFALLARRRLVDIPKARSLQNLVEAGFEFLLDFMQRFAGEHAVRFFPVVATFFLFILVSNWLSMFPGVGSIGLETKTAQGITFVPLLRGATSDLNTTCALAICSVASGQFFGASTLGLSTHLLRYFAISKWISFFRALFAGRKPRFSLLLSGALDVFIGVLELFDELTKILSFTFRLFGNIFGGEVLLLVIAFLMPFLVSIPFMALELFTGLVQAFIFAVLSTAFFARAVAAHSEIETNESTTGLSDGPSLHA